MTHLKNNTMTLRFRQSKAILIALAQGSLPWAALTVAAFCILLFAGSYFMTSEYIPLETKGMMLRMFSPMMFALGCIGVLVTLLFTHSALDEMRSQFPSYELMFPVPIWLSTTLHLVYKLLVWIVAYHILYWSSKYVVAGYIGNFSNLFEKVTPEFVFAALLFLIFQQIAWLQYNAYRIFWLAVHLAVLIRWYAWKDLDLMSFQIAYLLVLCYAQVYLQRRGGLGFDIVDAVSSINLDTGVERKMSPLRTAMEIQWKAWYRWIFFFNVVFILPAFLIYGITAASLVSAFIFIYAGYLTERRDASAMFCGTRPVKEQLLLRARHLNAFRCAAITLLLILGLDLVMDWVRFLSGSEYVYYSSDELKLRYLYERYINTDAKAAIVILYLSIYALTLACLWFALVAGRFLILLTVFVGCASLVASAVLMPIALFFKSFDLDGVMVIGIIFLQCLLTILSLKQRDFFVLRRYIRRDWIARMLSAALVASLGLTAMIVFSRAFVVLALFGAVVMLAMLAAKQMGTLEKRDALLLAFAALCAILAPLPVVLSFTDNLAQDWIAWSAVLFTALALPLLCVPITIRWQRVLG